MLSGCKLEEAEIPEPSPKPVPVRLVEAPLPNLFFSAPGMPEGAELFLLPNLEGVLLRARIELPASIPSGITLVECEFFLKTKRISPPGEEIAIRIPQQVGDMNWAPPEEDGQYRLDIEAVCLYRAEEGVSISNGKQRSGGTEVTSRSRAILVQVPVRGELLMNGYLLGVPIGEYPNPRVSNAPLIVRSHPEIYTRPDFFYRVDNTNRKYLISQNFRLADFDLTFSYWKPPYSTDYEMIALHPRILEKLELLLAMVRSEVLPNARFEILAGFRSPWYNEEIKREDMEFSQTSRFSTHMYGRAVDLIVDVDGDGIMDDLNGDGRIDIGDCRVLEKLVDRIDAESPQGTDSLLGGFGIYPRHDISAREVQTPYIHMDIRGYLNPSGRPSRWYMD